MRKICVSAPGKIHLLGEHSVVYGKPAILASVDKRCYVQLNSREDNLIKISFEGITQTFSEKEILKDVKNNYLAFIVGETIKFFNQKIPFGFDLLINSEIPLGCGMGSSAALAVSISSAVSLLFSNDLNKKIINNIAFECEKMVHGNPSGGDNTTCCFGGFIWYQRETKDKKIIKPLNLKLSDSLRNKFGIIYTGKPKETTGEMVSLVRLRIKNYELRIKKIFDDQGELVYKLLTALKKEDSDMILSCIKNGENNLEKLGVVSEYVKSIIREIEKIGGSAKICGGGGVTKGTGVLLVFCDNSIELSQLCNKLNLTYDKISLGVEGVKKEICDK